MYAWCFVVMCACRFVVMSVWSYVDGMCFDLNCLQVFSAECSKFCKGNALFCTTTWTWDSSSHECCKEVVALGVYIVVFDSLFDFLLTFDHVVTKRLDVAGTLMLRSYENMYQKIYYHCHQFHQSNQRLLTLVIARNGSLLFG
eukprot:TRINITY_DN40879_c0_g1_i3.p1 TRINITY_DN40879_c0_g1~~TRINITY_DN40879_c0_g1_i3.p1  ORF type:complete len:143 (-),score=14.60 TRINITY_DN40879_c0_g1_i3:38-466(-)